MKGSRLPLRLALALLVGVLGLDVYRAVTQSLTIDEATTYTEFVAGAPEALWGLESYPANHHVLNSTLAWVAVAVFGASEWSLRLPALLGGLLFCLMSLVVVRRTCGDGWLVPLGCAFLWLNPVTLDYLSKSRGYGLALGFAMLGIERFMRALGEDRLRAGPLVVGSAAFGLAIASNLVFLVALGAFAVTTIVAATVFHERRSFGMAARAAVAAVVPGLAVAAAIVAVPVSKMQNLRYGLADFTNSMRNLVEVSAVHHDGGLFGTPSLTSEQIDLIAARGLPALAGLLGIVAIFGLARRGATGLRPVVLCAGALAAELGALLLAKAVLDEFRFPRERTGLYIILTFSLATVAAAGGLARAGAFGRIVSAAFVLPMVACVAVFVSQLSWDHYASGRDDADTRAIFEELERRHEADGGPTPLRVGIWGWYYDSSLNAYRLMHDADWMAPVVRQKTPSFDFDYFVISGSEFEKARAIPGIEELERYPITGTVLARIRR